MSRRSDNHVVAEGVHIGQSIAAELSVGDDRGKVSGGMSSPISCQSREIVDEVKQHCDGGLVPPLSGNVGVLGAEKLLRQFEHPGIVVLG